MLPMRFQGHMYFYQFDSQPNFCPLVFGNFDTTAASYKSSTALYELRRGWVMSNAFTLVCYTFCYNTLFIVYS